MGQRIKELRKKSALTQQALADLLGVTDKAVSKWECGLTTPDVYMIGPLTKILHTSADELLGLCSEEKDEERKKYDQALQRYYNCESPQLNYAWARAAIIDYPNDYRYTEWLASAEYQLAFQEYKKSEDTCSTELICEMTDNALRRYESIIENCVEHDIRRKAVIGKIITLRFCERVDEAEWSAEFEYPDRNINNAYDIMKLTQIGQELLKLLEKEAEEEKTQNL
ncbi:MAG: helix-turn-helix transcriptional regulator [Clostridia bacterium]|nr:helix-turn-helix transcriptional regulator [Clostridia bacterium]